jgi:predicted ribosome quality control (RQC) complex YloA/Tae2 family protein
VSLIVELLGPGSVAILVDAAGMILEASRRASAVGSGTSARTIVPRAPYVPPAAPDRLDPRQLTGARLRASFVGLEPTTALTDAIVRRVTACSPQLAREAAAAAWGSRSGDPPSVVADLDGTTIDAIAEALREAWLRGVEGRWAPHLFVPGASDRRKVAFAPYPLATIPDAEPVASISEAIGAWHDQVETSQLGAAEATASKALRQAVEDRLDKARARQFSLAKSLADQSDTTRLRAAGEWLLAYPDRVDLGATSILIEPSAVGLSGPPTTIALDPALNAIGNAQRLFKRYQKARAAERAVPPLLEVATQERAYLEEAVVHLDLARTADDVRSLRDELAAEGFVSAGRREPNRGTRAPNRQTGRKGYAPNAKAAGPDGIDRLMIDGFDVLVGRSGRGNDAALRAPGSPEDLWLHARGVGGAHVIVRAAGRVVPEEVVRLAASVAAGRSAARTAPIVAVDVTARRNVTRVAGGPPGLVTYRNERTIQVIPAATTVEGRPTSTARTATPRTR